MAVREFNGTSDDLVQNLGAATSMTFGTAAMLLKFSTVTSFRSLFHFNNSSYTFVSAPLDLTNFSTFSTFYSTGSDSGFSVSTSVWYLVIIRKATGSATPHYSVFNYNTSSWTHGNHTGGAEANATAAGAGGRSGFAFQGSSDFFGGRVAARAAWADTLPWSADGTGDTNLIAAGLHTSAANWLTSNPSVFWLYNQDSTGTNVPDSSSGGTGTQISITGTTVINGDDPPGFDFSLTGTASPTIQIQRFPFPINRGGPWPRIQQIALEPPSTAVVTNAPADVATATGTVEFQTSGGSISLNLISDNPITAIGTAYDATISTAPHTDAAAGLASATGTANNTTVTIAPVVGLASATGTANNATVNTGGNTNASAGLASATGTANNTTSKVSPVPTEATATGTAYNPTVQTGSFTNASAGLASATGTANAPSPRVATGASAATGTGAAVDPSPAVPAHPGVATATGTANNATITRSANPQAGVATASGVVLTATLQVLVGAEAAAGLAAAYGATISGGEKVARSTAAVTDPQHGAPAVTAGSTSTSSVT